MSGEREKIQRGASASASIFDAARADLAAEAAASAEPFAVGGGAVDATIGSTSAALARGQESRGPRNPTFEQRVRQMAREGSIEATAKPAVAVAAGDDELAAAAAARIDGLDGEELRALASVLDDRLAEQILENSPGRSDLGDGNNEDEDELDGDELEEGGE